MKRMLIVVITGLVVVCSLAGCKKLTEGQVKLRDDLVGHWTCDVADLYFTTDKMTLVTGGKTYTFNYRVVHGDYDWGQVTLRVDKKVNDDKLETISKNDEFGFSFSDDRKELQVSGFILKEEPSRVTFTRADDKQEP